MDLIFDLVVGGIAWLIYRRRWSRMAFRAAALVVTAFNLWSLGVRHELSPAIFFVSLLALLILLTAEGELGSGWLAALAAAAFTSIVALAIKVAL